MAPRKARCKASNEAAKRPWQFIRTYHFFLISCIKQRIACEVLKSPEMIKKASLRCFRQVTRVITPNNKTVKIYYNPKNETTSMPF